MQRKKQLIQALGAGRTPQRRQKWDLRTDCRFPEAARGSWEDGGGEKEHLSPRGSGPCVSTGASRKLVCSWGRGQIGSLRTGFPDQCPQNSPGRQMCVLVRGVPQKRWLHAGCVNAAVGSFHLPLHLPWEPCSAGKGETSQALEPEGPPHPVPSGPPRWPESPTLVRSFQGEGRLLQGLDPGLPRLPHST